MKTNTKQAVIRYLKNGGSITVISPTHKYYGIHRIAEKIQTQSVRLEGGSWLYFKDIIPISEQGFKMDNPEGGYIEYSIDDVSRMRNEEKQR